jgi:hypothetical protein
VSVWNVVVNECNKKSSKHGKNSVIFRTLIYADDMGMMCKRQNS